MTAERARADLRAKPFGRGLRAVRPDPRSILRSTFCVLHSRFGPQHWWPGETDFEMMVGAILTQNTNWGNVERALGNLRAAGALNPRRLAELPPERLAEIIRPSGCFRVKAKRLRAFVLWLRRRQPGAENKFFRGTPTALLRQELLGLHGIGPETADSILLYALRRRKFVVDAYTRRVLARHGLAAPGATYSEIQSLFERNLSPSRRLYNEYHALIVRLGKEFCRAKPRCDHCPLEPLLGAALHNALPPRRQDTKIRRRVTTHGVLR
jgi:endonuclease-3 related protein